MNTHIDRYALTFEDRIRILDGSMLKDSHVEKFHSMLRNNSQFTPRSTLLIQNLMTDSRSTCLQPIPYYDSVPIYFEKVQSQKTATDCGVFAMAFATTIFKKKTQSELCMITI